MIEDSLYHSRISVVETKIEHLEEKHSKGFQELKELIIEARKEYHEDQKNSSTKRWQMMLAFYVAGLGLITNAIVNIVRDMSQ